MEMIFDLRMFLLAGLMSLTSVVHGNVTNLLCRVEQGEMLGFSIGAIWDANDWRKDCTNELGKVDSLGAARIKDSFKQEVALYSVGKIDGLQPFDECGLLVDCENRSIVGIVAHQRARKQDIYEEEMRDGTFYVNSHEYVFGTKAPTAVRFYSYLGSSMYSVYATRVSFSNQIDFLIHNNTAFGLTIAVFRDDVFGVDFRLGSLDANGQMRFFGMTRPHPACRFYLKGMGSNEKLRAMIEPGDEVTRFFHDIREGAALGFKIGEPVDSRLARRFFRDVTWKPFESWDLECASGLQIEMCDVNPNELDFAEIFSGCTILRHKETGEIVGVRMRTYGGHLLDMNEMYRLVHEKLFGAVGTSNVTFTCGCDGQDQFITRQSVSERVDLNVAYRTSCDISVTLYEKGSLRSTERTAVAVDENGYCPSDRMDRFFDYGYRKSRDELVTESGQLLTEQIRISHPGWKLLRRARNMEEEVSDERMMVCVRAVSHAGAVGGNERVDGSDGEKSSALRINSIDPQSDGVWIDVSLPDGINFVRDRLMLRATDDLQSGQWQWVNYVKMEDLTSQSRIFVPYYRGMNKQSVKYSVFKLEGEIDETDRTLDSDGDGLTDLEESAFGSDPHRVDTDGDGLTDFEEWRIGSNPREYKKLSELRLGLELAEPTPPVFLP